MKRKLLCNNVSVDDILKVFSFESFKKTCVSRQSQNISTTNPVFLSCDRCECGEKIKTGERNELPDNVILIVLDQKQQEIKQNGIKQKKRLAGSYKIPTKKAVVVEKNFTDKTVFDEKFGLTDLRYFWIIPLLTRKESGICPCCEIPERTSSAHGLCKNCTRQAYNLYGIEMLRELFNKANRMRKVLGLNLLDRLNLSDNLIIKNEYRI